MTSFDSGMIKDEGSRLQRNLINPVSADVVHVFRLHPMVSAINHSFMVWDIDELPWSIGARLQLIGNNISQTSTRTVSASAAGSLPVLI
jgi:hypothetical protein